MRVRACVRAHAARVQALVAVERALVVLRAGHAHGGLAIAEGEHLARVGVQVRVGARVGAVARVGVGVRARVRVWVGVGLMQGWPIAE